MEHSILTVAKVIKFVNIDFILYPSKISNWTAKIQ